jgi:hypothetical protein
MKVKAIILAFIVLALLVPPMAAVLAMPHGHGFTPPNVEVQLHFRHPRVSTGDPIGRPYRSCRSHER